MAPRNTLTQHQKSHIRRQLNGQSATCMRSLAERLGVSKSKLGNILAEGRQVQEQVSLEAATSPLQITFDFFHASFANLEVKGESVSPEKETLGRLKERDVNEDSEKDEAVCLEVKKEPLSLERNEGRKVNEENNKARQEESVLMGRLMKSCLNDNSALLFPVSVSDHEATKKLSFSLQELTNAMITLRQVVESYRDMPRWFTFTFDHMFQSYYPEEDADSEVRWEKRGTANLPSRQDIVSALQVLCEVLRSGHALPAWCAFTWSRLLQRYRSRQRWIASQGVERKGQRSLSTSLFSWTWY